MTAVRQRPLETQLEDLTARLIREYADVPAGAVRDTVEAVRAEFAAATVLSYLPVLVERGVRSRLGAGYGIGGSGSSSMVSDSATRPTTTNPCRS